MKAVRFLLGRRFYNRPMSQAEFGALFDTAYTNVSKWERGRVFPPEAVLRKLVIDYGISADWILFEVWRQLAPELVEPLRSELESISTDLDQKE